jgi:signal transduction histidine kinase
MSRDPAMWRHDIKNQLGIVLGFTEVLLADMTPDDPRYEDLREIHAAAHRAMALVRELTPEPPPTP